MGIWLDRLSLRALHLWVGVASAACSVVCGLTDVVWINMAAYLAFLALTSLLIAPTSMWVSRTAGAGSQTAAFTVHKIITALTVALAMAVLGWLEPRIGMRHLFLYGGLLGLPCALGYAWLKEP